MPTVQEFWAESRWGDHWGVTRIVNGVRTNPHRGHDGKATPGEVVPALRAGRVAMVSDITKSSIVGYHVVLLTPSGAYDYYCHLLVGTRPNLGDWIDVGESVGKVAGWSDFHGSAWTGPHVHFGSGPSIRSVYEGTTYNATEIVRQVLAQVAPAVEDIKEIIIMTAKEVWEFPLQSLATGKDNEAGNFLTAAAKNAADAKVEAASAVDAVRKLSNGYETAHPDPVKAAKGEKHTDSLQSRVGAIHIRTWLIPGLVAKVDQILGKLNALTAPQVTVDAAVLEAAFGAALDARLDTIAAKVAEKITYPTEGTITLRAVENAASE